MNKLVVLALSIVAIVIGWSLLATNNKISSKELSVDNIQSLAESKDNFGFKSVSSQDLYTMLENKDFTLIDVHIPEQQHIPGTDYMIPYNEIENIVNVIPNKNSKVVLYCRSGSMSKSTAKALVEMGYSNVIELDKGLNQWLAEGRSVLPKGSI